MAAHQRRDLRGASRQESGLAGAQRSTVRLTGRPPRVSLLGGATRRETGLVGVSWRPRSTGATGR
jgi:hypothetical protein